MVKRYINKTGQALTVTTADGENIEVPNNGIVVGKYYAQFAPPLTYYDDNGQGLDFSSGVPSRVVGGGSGSAFVTDDKVNPSATELQSTLLGTDPRPNTRANALGNSTSFDVYDVLPSDPIIGTSGSNTFTRSSGTWDSNSLINQYAFTYQDSDATTGSWNRILGNNTNLITVEGTVFSGADRLILSVWNPIGDSFSTEGGAFYYTNISSDGSDLWLAPYVSNRILRMNPVTGRTTVYNHGQSTAQGVSLGGTYDGQSMWFAPYTANFLRVGTVDGATSTSFAHDKGDRAFSSMVFTGDYLYAAPHSSTHIARVDPETTEITYIEHGATNTDSGQAGYHYYAVAHHGDYLWFAPYAASTIMRLHIPTGRVHHIPHGEGNLAFTGVIATPDGIYFIPANADNILRIDPGTSAITRFAHNSPSEPSFNGGTYDGRRYIYMNDQFNCVLARFDTVSGNIVRYPLGKGNSAFFGCFYFDNQIFMAPYNSTEVLRIRLPQSGAGGLNVHGRLSASTVELNLEVHATNAAAAAVLPVGTLYQNTTGDVKVVVEEV